MNVEFVPYKKFTVNSTESGWLPDWQNGHRQLFYFMSFLSKIFLFIIIDMFMECGVMCHLT